MADEDDRWLYGDGNPDTEDSNTRDNFNSSEQAPDPSSEISKDEVLQPPEIHPPDDDDDGEDDDDDNDKKTAPNAEDNEETTESTENRENSEHKENGELEEEEDDDEDSDEDNVNVIIGDINKTGPTYTNINISKRGPMIPAPSVKTTGKFSIEEFETVGVINGTPAHEFNVDVLEDKPWRIPGADITDYFNYGFNEDTWKAYCERQKRIRTHESCAGLPAQTMSSQPWQAMQSAPPPSYGNNQGPMFQGSKKPGWEAGQIRVIGSGVASRRLDEGGQENQTLGTLPPSGNFDINHRRGMVNVSTHHSGGRGRSGGMPAPNLMPPLIPPMEIPPPGFPGPVDPFCGPPPPSEYFNPEPDYFSYEPTAADQWRDNWTPGTLVTPGQNVKTIHSHLDDSNSQDRQGKDRDRDRERDKDRDRDRDADKDDKDKRKERSHRNRSRSKSHERKRNKSRSRSPSHKKHKKKSKKSDRKKRSDEAE